MKKSKATVPARKAFEEAMALARKTYDEAMAPAEKATRLKNE